MRERLSVKLGYPPAERGRKVYNPNPKRSLCDCMCVCVCARYVLEWKIPQNLCWLRRPQLALLTIQKKTEVSAVHDLLHLIRNTYRMQANPRRGYLYTVSLLCLR